MCRRNRFLFISTSDFVVFCIPWAQEQGRRLRLDPRGCHLGVLVPPFSHPGTNLAPREHPGRAFWHLGTTLEDHGSSRGGPEQDDGQHSLECLELRVGRVSLLNRGVWGGWAGAEQWDFHTFRRYLLGRFSEGNRFCKCVGSQVVFS